MRDVHRLVRGWMESAGMQVRIDSIGNMRALYGEGPRLMIGSHLDTVPDAGAFDGILGVMIAIALVESKPPRAIEVIGFSDEEGTRFGTPFLGSLAVIGTPFREEPVLDAIRAFGLDPAQLPDAILSPDVRGFLEFHIEQGPVLAGIDRRVAVVDSIVGQSRGSVRFTGKANHAGTTPMDARCDALAVAAEWIAEVEALAKRTPGLMATVGSLQVEPGAANVIPGVVRASIDVRHAGDAVRLESVQHLHAFAQSAAQSRHVECEWRMKLDEPAVPMDRAMVEGLDAALQSCGHPGHRMASGAGHDAMVMARKVPAAMLFMRSPNGISHHPDEIVLQEDVEAALQVGVKFLESWRPQ
jgi:allantoate deiminase